MSSADYADRKYSVLPYDPNWTKQFEMEATALKSVFGEDAKSIEHIGSTAVPGMAGKPTIDILIPVEQITVAEKHKAQVESLGYEYCRDFVMPHSVLFRKMENNTLLVNAHVFESTHLHVQEMIALRDYLRERPEEVEAYSNLKKGLFEKYPDDYLQYRKLKDEYMAGLKARLR